jgi:predicted transposase/invertase (TIGR01784 family)
MKFLNARKEEELTMLAEKNPLIGKAVSRLVELSQDERTRLLAESREKMRRDIAAREQGAANKGRMEGRVEAQLAIARNLLKIGLPVEKITEATGLSLEEIQSLRLH